MISLTILRMVIIMSVKLKNVALKATDSSAQIFDINTLEQLVECMNNQHNIDQLHGTLYFDNKQQLFFDDKNSLFGAMFALEVTDSLEVKGIIRNGLLQQVS